MCGRPTRGVTDYSIELHAPADQFPVLAMSCDDAVGCVANVEARGDRTVGYRALSIHVCHARIRKIYSGDAEEHYVAHILSPSITATSGGVGRRQQLIAPRTERDVSEIPLNPETRALIAHRLWLKGLGQCPEYHAQLRVFPHEPDVVLPLHLVHRFLPCRQGIRRIYQPVVRI